MTNKNGYYLIQHAELISKISNQTLQSDIATYMRKVDVIPLEHFVFRNEIIRDLEKNIEVLKK